MLLVWLSRTSAHRIHVGRWASAHVAQEEEVAPVDLGVWLCRNGSFAVAAWALARVVSADTLALAQRVSDTGMS